MEVEGLPVRDSTHDYTVIVTQEDVDGAVPQSECDCATARAINRVMAAHGRDCQASVGREVVTMWFKDRVERLYLSPTSKAIIRTFDQHDVFPEGVRIVLTAPPPGKRIGARANRSPASKKKGPKTTTNPAYPYTRRHVKMPRIPRGGQ